MALCLDGICSGTLLYGHTKDGASMEVRNNRPVLWLNDETGDSMAFLMDGRMAKLSMPEGAEKLATLQMSNNNVLKEVAFWTNEIRIQ